MQPTQTGIAVAVAVAAVAFFFLFNGLSLFQSPAQIQEQSDIATELTNIQTSTTPAPMQDITELQAKDESVGTGASAEAGDTITVNYVGSLTNGTVFDASANHGSTGFTFTLGRGEVIQGWDQGLIGMKEGGKRMLLIPAELAYGARAVGDVIPANSDLVFQVELLSVVKGR